MSRRSDHREPAAADVELVAVVAQLRALLRRVERGNGNLRDGNEVPRKAAGLLIHQMLARERFAFVYPRRDRFSVTLLCKILVTDRGSGYAWVRSRGKRTGGEHGDRRPTGLILEVHAVHPKPDRGAAAVPDLIRRQFTAPMPRLKLTGDIGCFTAAEGWPDHAAARRDIENWIKSCKERRLHSSLGYQTRSRRVPPGRSG